ncbi:N-acetylmuramic acid 6-phosphate etherase [Phyllobacterium brassicacearum]|uniref:N-acetylmuramic acid 6-phosphate etherase n=1 Tax=Phyllobacterium brassicacearum TaxID=314235 RepID=A0A2P7BU34_9HYPH|nr:N-acetylmuramic acid 6-phosphate etherase [Phyllobacterium brassicacearum]PSH69986.1 N-acetylmuramic acid 6-phosphate etherase [Phyllobacterium brassicacearum]TDQ35172.1 N-acetylmuramic acid 6-phosphate etherase [Phyllobacterium brassicacearum]
MGTTRTEQRNDRASGLDERSPEDILRLLYEAQVEAAASVARATDSIAKASLLAAETLRAGGRLAYAAAGSSGLMALADALELPGTYGIAPDRIVILLAGGVASLNRLAGTYEDDTAQAARDIAAAGLAEGDCLIAISASGSTPYALAAIDEATNRGLKIISIANNPDVPLFSLADVAITLPTPPEMVAGSTRMGAGTAQKIALNLLSTLMAVHLGHVHDGYMVNLTADNIKLRERAARIVSAISACDISDAARLLEASGGSVKSAILLAAGAPSAEQATEILESNQQRLRPALSKLKGSLGSR